jgi:dienelactone hydrolase
MKTPEWLSPGLYGAGLGAIALAIVGFSWGGWVTGRTAQKMADNASLTAVVSAMTPYCVARSTNDPKSVEILAELKSTQGYNRRTIIENAGWATPLGAERPNSDLAAACSTALGSS